MDLTRAAAPRSDQTNADDLIGGPMTVTIQEVTEGTAEQPVSIALVERPGRPYKPSKSMIRVLLSAWGPDASTYAGRRLRLVRNPDIRFGKDVVGGIEIEAMSHIKEPLRLALTVTRGKKKAFTVQPLAEPSRPSVDWDAELAAAGGDMDAIRGIYNRANSLGDTAALAKIKAAGDAILAATTTQEEQQ
jgi:hypothetical protein